MLLLVAQGPTIFPASFKSFSKKAETALSVALGQHLAASSAIRQVLETYLHLAGIETGYGYFAPNVPGSYKLVFELHYTDGRVEYELPSVSGAAAGTRQDVLREYLVKTLARSIWREHPEVQTVRAVLGSIRLPTVSEFEHGQRESYEFMYAYDFALQNDPARPKGP